MDEFTQPLLSAQRRKCWNFMPYSKTLKKHTATTRSFTSNKESANYVACTLNFKATIVYLLQPNVLKVWQNAAAHNTRIDQTRCL